MSIDPTRIESPDLLAGARILEIESDDQRWQVGLRHENGPEWQVFDHHQPILASLTPVRTYPDAPGMDARVALMRWLAEREDLKRERERIAVCDGCGQPVYADQPHFGYGGSVAGEPGAVSGDFHVDCEEANGDGEE